MQSRRQRLHCKLWLVAQIPDAVAVAEQQIEAGVARCDGWQRFAVCACAERAAQISGYQPTARRCRRVRYFHAADIGDRDPATITGGPHPDAMLLQIPAHNNLRTGIRSEERRVGKEGVSTRRTGESPQQQKKKL